MVKKFPKVIKVFIGDRTLGDFESIVRNRYRHGDKLIKIYRVLSCKWTANNVDGFVENTNCFKIDCFDEDDDVIDIYSSHHHGVAKKWSKVDYNTGHWVKFYESLKFLFDIERELYNNDTITSLQENRHQFNQQLMDQVNMAEDVFKGSQQAKREEALKPTLSFKPSEDTHQQTHTHIENQFKLFDYSFSLKFIRDKLSNKNIARLNQTLDLSQTQDPDQSLAGTKQFISKLFALFYQLVVVLSDFEAGCLKLTRIISQTRISDFRQFESFLQVLETYGTGYQDDIDSRNYKLRDTISHRNQAIKDLRNIVKAYDLALVQLEEIASLEMAATDRYSAVNSKTLREQLKILF